MPFVLVRDGVTARSAVNPDQPAVYQTRSDAELAVKHATTHGWQIRQVEDSDDDS